MNSTSTHASIPGPTPHHPPSPASNEGPLTALSYLDVVVLVIAAPIMLVIGVPAVGYAVGAGAWIVLRGVGIGVERVAAASRQQAQELAVRMGFLLGRLFLLAIAVILARQASKDDGLTALLVIVFAYTFSMILSIFTRAWSR